MYVVYLFRRIHLTGGKSLIKDRGLRRGGGVEG